MTQSMGLSGFGYANARLMARHARRPSDGQWLQLEASRTAAHALAVARSGPWARWTEGLDAEPEAHAIERVLRRRWQGHVDEVASWLPAGWQAAARWLAWLPLLPLVDAWGRGDAAAARDLLPLATAPGAAPPPGGAAPALLPFEPLRQRRPGTGAAALWLLQWRRLAPVCGDAERAALEPAQRLLPALGGAAAGPAVRRAGAPPDAGSAAAGGGRAGDDPATPAAVRRLMRRGGASAAGVVAHLVLDALEVERLRGDLVSRCLLAPPGAETA